MNTLLVPFVDESHSFTNGFECGMIWELMSNNVFIEDKPVHNENLEQIKLIAEHFGYDYSLKDGEDGSWHFLSGKPISIDSVYKEEVPNEISNQFKDYLDKKVPDVGWPVGMRDKINKLALECMKRGYLTKTGYKF